MRTSKVTRKEREVPAGVKILAGYLALSLVPAVFEWVGGRGTATVVLFHTLALIAVAAVVASRRSGAVVDWLPLVAIPFLYAELPRIEIGGPHDGAVQRWEAAVFGTSPVASLSMHWPNAFLSEMLHAAYLSYYLIIYGPPLLLYLRGQMAEFRSTTAGLMTMFAICYFLFIVFPVDGPRYEWAAPTSVFDGPVRRFALRLLEAGSSKGTAFPSSHVAVATVQAILAFRWSTRTGLLLCALTSCLGIGAVYGGFHYGIDVLAGTLLGLAIGIALVFARRESFAGSLSSVAATVSIVDESAGDMK